MKETFIAVSGLLLQIIVGFAPIFLFKAAVVSKTALGRLAGKLDAGTRGLTNRAKEFGENRAFYQRRKMAREARQRNRQYENTEDYARLMAGSGWRSRALRRRAGGYFSAQGQQRAYADVHGVVEKQFNEDKDRARSMMSVNVARAFGDAGNDEARLAAIMSGASTYTTRNGQTIGFSSQDHEAIKNLGAAGFLSGRNNRAGAAAALDELFDQQFVERSDIEHLAQVAGTDTESAGLMTKTIANAAAKNKYKNFTYGAIESGSGQYVQYQPGPGTKDGLRIVESGVSGAPKEIFDDASILAGLAHKTEAVGTPRNEAALVDVARQTMGVDKASTIRSIASAVGLSENDFVQLRQAIQTNTLTPQLRSQIAATAQPVTARSGAIKSELKATLAKRRAAGEFVDPSARPVGSPANDLDYILTL